MKIWDFKKYVSSFILGTVTLAATMSIQAYNTPATSISDMAQFPNVTVSSTKEAWTTDAGDKTNERHEKGYTVYTGVTSSLRSLKSGEHYYTGTVENGSINIGKWVCMWPNAKCIHNTEWERPNIGGFSYSNNDCFRTYNNGWYAYCADCGELVKEGFIYAKESTIQKIKSMPASSYYVYLCPHCNGIENTFDIEHTCTKISDNRYQIRYDKNTPSGTTVVGKMMSTKHMYNNSDTYEGSSVEDIGYTDTALRVNAYSAKGYVFTGWNTKADGSGISYKDGQAVKNLTAENKGTVTLYAQWKRVTSTLAVNANGGKYNGSATWTTVQNYGTYYTMNSSLLTPPAGYNVTFTTNGGSAVSSITTRRSFLGWEAQGTLNGSFENGIYTFQGPAGSKDTIHATYKNESFTLPSTTKANASLVGWYSNASLSDESFIGRPGDTLTVSQNTVLYAKWADLTLYSANNYTANNGKGAVNLNWKQNDGAEKYYEVFQSKDKKSWTKLITSTALNNSLAVSQSYDVNKRGTSYTVQYTGWYTLTAYGGKGGNYGNYYGGNGGLTTGTFYLKSGDVLYFYPGSAASGTTGGSNTKGAGAKATQGGGGGAASYVELVRNGVRTGLLVAGGGGGANSLNSGTAGGTTTASSSAYQISSAASAVYGGGGGGYVAGKTGEAKTHSHTSSCYHTHTDDCYHKHTDNCYKNYIKVDEGRYWEYNESCGCKVGVHTYYCTYCNKNLGERKVKNAANCTQGHVTADEGPVDNCTDDNGNYNDHSKKLNCDEKNCGYDLNKAICGYTNNYVIGSSAATGGSSWINTGYYTKNISMQAGKGTGNGSITLTSVKIGLHENTVLNNVSAADLAAPNKISFVQLTKNYATNKLTAVIVAPKDNGTTYYHKVNSYSLRENTVGTLNLTSNITINTLTTGVAGYYYVIDTNSGTNVTKSHSYTSGTTISSITQKTYKQYLHVAAVDKAGNLGLTTHVNLGTISDNTFETDNSYMQTIKLITKQLVLKETDYTYKISDKSYYVKADGKTEHKLVTEGYMSGAAAPDYQIDSLKLLVTANNVQQWVNTVVPRGNITASSEVYENAELKTEENTSGLTHMTVVSVEAKRSAKAVNLSVEQTFTIDKGKGALSIYPQANATFKGVNHTSNDTEDKTHNIVLIPDSTPPTIIGLDNLKGVGNLSSGQKTVMVRAEDHESGMKNLSVTIRNTDNPTFSRTYTGTNSVNIVVKSDDYLFKGDFTVEAVATDNVGNEQWNTSSIEDYTLYATLDKMTYKAGEKPTITATTYGYADKVTITFPYEIAWRNPDLDKEYVYRYPDVMQSEEYEFIIPLDTPNGQYTIIITAYKKDRTITKELTFTVEGMIIEKPLRTSIIDNGV